MIMTPRQGTSVLTSGLFAALLALVAPAMAQNPLTPLRPVEPPKGAPPAAGSASPTADSRAAPMPAPLATPSAPAAAMPVVAPPSIPGDAALADAALEPRTRRSGRRDPASGGIKLGRWEFTARLQLPGGTSVPTPASAPATEAAGGMQTTYTTCIEADNAVPADLGPQCRLERHDRRRSQVSWSMSCANTGVRSDGLAQYRGETMQATVVSHMPGAGGKVTEMRQHLTGRYLGPCQPSAAAMLPTGTAMPPGAGVPPAAMPATAAAPAMPAIAASPAMPATAASQTPRSAEPTMPGNVPVTLPPSTGGTGNARSAAVAATAGVPPAAETAETSPRIERGSRQVRGGRYAHRGHRHHRQHVRRSYRAWYGSARPLGPSPTSSAGP